MTFDASASKEQTSENVASSANSCTPIAIVGIGFRGPGDAKNVDKLWEMILAGREAWSRIPSRRWNNEAFYHPDNSRHGAINVEGGHFLEEDVSVFDAPFFNMTGDEAAAMDPQQRLLLEVAYESLENAGIPLAGIAGTETSCFVGSFSADYTDLLLRDPECVPMYQCTNAGQSRAMAANRLSYFFVLKGPSVTVDTACSGSLVALHLACQSLQTGDASTAIAAGVNLILSHEFMSTMSMMRFLSPDGRCHTFDEKANGYARGEGVGCLILKPLAKALHDGNTIRAVIRGTGSNQDGRTAGIALPNRVAQENLIRSVYARAGLDPSETDFVEAHGTGTQAGDPLETGAISLVFGAGRAADRPVRIGSIKTNVGHLEGASGVAGVIKAVLMLENRMFLPNRNFEKINPRIMLEDWKLKIQLYPEPWKTAGARRVSVNSFGYGGSNAHVIIEEAVGYLSRLGSNQHKLPLEMHHHTTDDTKASTSIGSPRIYLFSGFDEASCTRQMQSLHRYVVEKGSEAIDSRFLDNLAFTLNERRTILPWKATVVAGTMEDLTSSLSRQVRAKSAIKRPKLGFVFTGQGAQWPGMGKELLQAYPVFQDSVMNIDSYLDEIDAGFRVQEEIVKLPEDSNLSHPSLSQTVCTALQIALVDLLRSWGIYPDSVVGHSSGEIAAAYASGALNMKDAMAVAYYRGLLASQLLNSPIAGAMMAVGMSAEEVQPYLDRFPSRQLVVACINSPSSVTISGDTLAMEQLTHMLESQQVFSRRLEVGVAYHSPHMEKVAQQYGKSIGHIELPEPAEVTESASEHPVPKFFSSVYGTMLAPEELVSKYWVSNLTGQVNFAASLKTLCFETQDQHSRRVEPRRLKRSKSAKKPSVDCLVEIGPHSALAGPIKQILRADAKLSSADIAYISVLTRKNNAVTSAVGAAATLASFNYPINFKAINRPHYTAEKSTPETLVDLPPYSWDHTRAYWAEPRLSKMYRNRPTPRLDLLGAPDNIACPFEPRWRNYLRTSELPWLLDHKIQGSIIFPAAGYLTMAIEAAKQLTNMEEEISTYLLQEVEIKSALVLSETSAVELMISLLKPPHSQDRLFTFHIYSVSDDNKWTEHCTGLVGRQESLGTVKDGTEDADGYIMVPLGTEVHGLSVLDIQDLYERLRDSGLEYGPCFSNLTEARITQDGACFAETKVPDTRSVMPAAFQHDLLVHPCTLDSIFHTILAALPPGMGVEEGPVIPVSIEEMTVSSDLSSMAGDLMSICTQVRRISSKDVTACIVVMDKNEKRFDMEASISIHGLRCARLSLQKAASNAEDIDKIYKVDWKADFNFLHNENSSFLFENANLQEKTSTRKKIEQHSANFVRAALLEVGSEEAMNLDASRRRFRCHLEDALERYDEEQSGPMSRSEEPEPAPTGSLLHRIGSNLSGIIRNQVDYSTIVEDEPSLAEYWDIFAADMAYQAAANYVGLIGHKKPDISILEFGVGTGQIAEIFLKHLVTLDGSSTCGKYTFAHESASVLEQASENLHTWSEWVECKLLDLCMDLSKQGMEQNSFDVIILPHGLCTAHCERDALVKIYDLLAPSGCLIAINSFDPKEDILKSILFGALHCLSAEGLCLGQGAWSESQWSEILNDVGFNTVNTFAEGSHKSHQFIVAKKQASESSLAKVSIVCQPNVGDSTVELVSQLEKISSKVTLTDIQSVDPSNQICLVLDTLPSILVEPDMEMLTKIKAIFMHSAGVLWITRGGTIEPVNPDAGLVYGFARTARAESGVQSIVTLDLDSRTPLSDPQCAEVISNLLIARFLRGTPDIDSEFAERNGIVLIPRVMEDLDATESMRSSGAVETVSTQSFQQPDQPFRLSRKTDQPGFVSDAQISDLPADHIAIKVHSFGLTKWDSLQDSRSCETDDTLGMQCSGFVYKVGSAADEFTLGDRVACLGAGTARTFYQDRASAFQRLRDDMPMELASSIPLAYSIAFYAVNHLAHIKSGDLILVHNAGSYFGQAIVDIILMKKAHVFAIVESSHESDLLASKYGIPRDFIFRAGQIDVGKNLLRMTDGKKASTVFAFDSVEERVLHSCITPFGQLIQLGTDVFSTQKWSCPQNMSISVLNIFELCKERKDLLDHLWLETAQLFLDERLKGLASLHSYGVSSFHEAIDAASTKQHAVVSAKRNDIVKVTLPMNRQPIFRENASYLLVGGLGGIGRELALWMARNGAKSLILFNRSGMSSDKSQRTVRELLESGAQVTIRACDICNEANVSQTLHDVAKCAPPIRGLIQAAMVLKDVHIENMQPDDYRDVMSPKYHGTWNLHRNLATNLDFFVMLSSISGVIGNATQAAYASGCAFQDSFAAYRNSLGLPALAIDLGVITDVGYLAENKSLAEKMKLQGFHGMNTTSLLSLMQVAVTQPPRERAQIITGLGRWKEGKSLGNFDAPLFSHFRRKFQTGESSALSSPSQALKAKLNSAKSTEQAATVICEAIGQRLAAHLSIPVENIDPSNRVSEYGVDSHVAVELRNWISKSMMCTIPLLEILAKPLMDLSQRVASEIFRDEEE